VTEGPGRWSRFRPDSQLRVRLTATGRQILSRHSTQLGWPAVTPDQEGWIELKVHEIMRIFGGPHSGDPFVELVVKLPLP
jgi:hypothetical protein